MPVQAGDKFAAIVLGRCSRLTLRCPVQLTPELSVERGPVVDLDNHWRDWLGWSRADLVNDRALVFLAKRPSAAALVFDAESRDLQRQVYALAYGALLGGVPNYQPDALLLAGGVGPAGAEIRHIETLRTFFRHGGNVPIAMVDEQYARDGGSRSAGVVAAFAGNDTLRFRRGFNAWLRGLWEESANKRLHQFVRSLDGVLKLRTGRSRRDFVARCPAFVTSADAPLVLGELYDLRSIEEHLNDWHNYLNALAGAQAEARYSARAWQAERLASGVYAKLFATPALRAAFVDDAATDAFWGQQQAAIVTAWNMRVDLDAAARESGYGGP